MHAKSAEVTRFLEKDLLPQVKEAFRLYRTADKADLEKELAKAVEQGKALGANPEDLPKVQELRAKIANEAVDTGGLENEVYDHLFSFFRRYYSEGDFLAKRVYKPGVYAIPYEGEEVKLHWANHDQFYIKTSEHLREYSFRLRPDDTSKPLRVHFQLADAAEGQHGNVKEADGKERAFILKANDFVAEENGELVLRFEYRPAAISDWPEEARRDKTKAPAQKDLVDLAVKRVLAITEPSFALWITELARRVPTESEPDRTVLQKHIKNYSDVNTFDYFIHDDLGRFLRRELDFYIKNEVMYLDDVQSETMARVEQYLSKIKVFRAIANKIIEFLAQLEDFQKRLWLKKKFIIQTQYCITLSRIPVEFHEEIAANDGQRQEWLRLHVIDEVEAGKQLTSEFLKLHPTLVVDTQHFPSTFTARLIASFDNLDEDTDGVLINGENFQALSILQASYLQRVQSIYIDPPYNTDAGPIIYKNGYRHSSWLALMDNRLTLNDRLMTDDAILCVTIDDAEVHHLRSLLESAFPKYELLGAVPIKNNPAGRTGTVGFSVCHEYALFYGQSSCAKVGRMEHTDAQIARYKERDELGAFEWTNFRKHGGLNTYRVTRPRQFYPIYVKGTAIRIPKMEWDNASRVYKVFEEPAADEEVLLPIDDNGRERIWDFVVDTARANLEHLKVRKDTHGATAIYRKWRLNVEGILPKTWWDKSEYSAAEHGTNLLTNIFGYTHAFTFQNPFTLSPIACESKEIPGWNSARFFRRLGHDRACCYQS
jgi:adenine-specific DNA-methyltransferase